MGAVLTQAEAILHRTGPNNITVLFEADGGFDAACAFRGIQMLTEGAERFCAPLLRGRFGATRAVDWRHHVCIVEDTAATAPGVMDLARRLALPMDRPLWRAAMVNPQGAGWSGLVLHFDHAIADGTRIARHIVRNVLPSADDVAATQTLPRVTLSDLANQTDPRLAPAPIGLCRVPFDDLRAAIPGATGHGDALLRLARGALDRVPEFADVATARKDNANVAKIEALQTGKGLGNQSMMAQVDLSKPSIKGERGLFRPRRPPFVETLRMGAARFVPSPLLRRIVQAEFSRPGIVQTVVPVSRKPLPLFGLPLAAIHPAAPVLGCPLIALAATRFGDGFDVSITAHGPDGRAGTDLSTRVATAMLQSL